VFNGEFVAGDKNANKSIATRNYEFFRFSDLRVGYALSTTYRSKNSKNVMANEALSRILNLTVNANKYNPLHTGCHIQF